MPDPVPNDRPAAAASRPKHVLVVDDEKNIRLTLRQVLEEEGLRVDTASDGDDALGKVRAASGPDFELVLLDLRMPGTGGMEVLRQLRETHPELPVVVFTAHSNAENATEAMKLGATDFAAKPFSPQQVRALVRDLDAAPAATAPAADDERGSERTDDAPSHHTHCTLVALSGGGAPTEALLSLAAASAHSYAHGEVVALALTPDVTDDAVATHARELGVPVRTRRATDGRFRETIRASAEEESPDHVLLPWSGAPAEARALDAFAQQLADEMGTEVTLARPGRRASTQRIAARVSRAPHTLVAVRRALEIARSAGVARLTLLSAQTAPPEGDEERLRRDGRALIRQVARKAGLTEGQYHAHQTVATDERALVRVAEDFDTLCVSAVHGDALADALFGEGEGSDRIRGTIALVRGPEHREPTVLESLLNRLSGT
jgi:CheY-like chemotaxis protein